jgi:hypothetical protein
MALWAPDHMMIPPGGKGVFRPAWDWVTGPVMLGKVALMAALMRRRWSSAVLMASEAAGLVSTSWLMYVADSRDIRRPRGNLKGVKEEWTDDDDDADL